MKCIHREGGAGAPGHGAEFLGLETLCCGFPRLSLRTSERRVDRRPMAGWSFRVAEKHGCRQQRSGKRAALQLGGVVLRSSAVCTGELPPAGPGPHAGGSAGLGRKRGEEHLGRAGHRVRLVEARGSPPALSPGDGGGVERTQRVSAESKPWHGFSVLPDALWSQNLFSPLCPPHLQHRAARSDA